MAMTGASATKSEMMAIAGIALRALSAANLLRYTIQDIRDLASGKGGLGDIISLGTNSILLMYQLSQILKINLVLSSALNASILAGAAMYGPMIIGAGVAIGGIMLGQGYARGEAAVRNEQSTRRNAARALGLQ